jgi:LysM repeat protein
VRVRLTLVCACAAVLAVAAPARALNPQHAGLQVALRSQGLYLGPIDAVIGPKTAAAVRRFQQVHHLRVTGIADVHTRRALGPLGTPLFGSRTLTRGSFGWDVAVLQFLLNRHGISVPVNAYLDGPTYGGLRRYQRQLHLRADGVVGPATFTALGIQSRIPVRPKKPAPVRRHTFKHYVVKAGDSLIAISRRFHLPLAKLDRINHLDPTRPLLIGKRLRIPVVRVVPAAVPATDAGAIRAAIDRWSAHYRIDPTLARALAWMESGYNNRVVSSVGARGVMQLLPSTWRYVEDVLIHGRVQHDADGNVRVGLAYLRHLLTAFHGNERLALAGWYQGERSVRSRGPYKVSKLFVADVLALRQRM